ncbi:MAG: CoA transferase, partial [Actinomycetota bacterium]|nr:CoA transferase [Actinomycetota bacterium]
VEPPDGAESRRLPPCGAEGSLYWETVALGKRSLVADLATDDGRNVVRSLARSADVLIESFDPGTMAACGLSFDDLAAENPRLVVASITPYGQTGPKAAWAANDLTIEAAGGRLALQRDTGRPPVPVGYPQASFHAGVQAAADVLVAVHERERSGLGQHLDVSMQAVMVHTIFSQASGALLNDARESVGTMDDPDAERAAKLTLLPGIWRCADGYVAAPLTAGALPLVAHIMSSEPGVDDDLRAYDWTRLVADVLRGRVEDELVLRAIGVVERFFVARTKAELFALAFDGDFRLGPLQTTRDLLDDPHLVARSFWSGASAITRPGAAVRLSRTPMRVDLPVARSVGTVTADEVERAWRGGVSAGPSSTGERDGEAFTGLRVADFSWVAVGPTIGRAFADHGATVVRVESRRRLDVARTLAPWKGAAKGIDDSNWYAHYNAGKFGLACDLSTDDGRRVARDLIDWADVVIESFSPGTMQRLGLDYDAVSQTNPGLVMLSTSLLGQTGPMASFAGFGQQAVGLCGISTITGWPDRPPLPPMGAYTDIIAPKYGVAAIAAALFARRRDGFGQHLDMSQVEASIRFIEPLVLDESVNGRTAVRPGVDSPTAAPSGLYPLRGENRYLAMAIETDDQWRTLRRIVGPPLAPFPDELTTDERRARRTDIDASLAAWSATQDGATVEEVLAAAGVPAARAAKPAHVAHDPQLEHRNYFVPLEHRAMGTCAYEAPATIFSAKRTPLHRAAPCLGEHSEYVLRSLLGYQDDEVARLAAAGILE